MNDGHRWAVPRFRTNADGTAACRHRDLSVCADCAMDPAIVEVVGAHYHLPDPAERDTRLGELRAAAFERFKAGVRLQVAAAKAAA